MIIKCRLVIKHYLFIKTIFKICISPIVLVRLRLSLGLKIDLLHTLGLAPARILRSRLQRTHKVQTLSTLSKSNNN